jgi:hypothetical protein
MQARNQRRKKQQGKNSNVGNSNIGNSNWSPPNSDYPTAGCDVVDDSSNMKTLGQYNPYCNMIAGLCTTDPNNLDYEPSCPNAQHANYLTTDTHEYYSDCYQQPIQQCTLFAKAADATGVTSIIPPERTCSAINPGACWSRSLCNLVGASWQASPDDPAAHFCTKTPSCPAISGVSYTQTACVGCGDATSCNSTLLAADAENPCAQCCASTGINAATGKCNTPAPACKDASGNACACVAGPVMQAQAKGSDGSTRTCKWGCGAALPDTGCGWSDDQSQCLLQCRPGANVCDNCGGPMCTAPCFWSSDDPCADHTLPADCNDASLRGACAWNGTAEVCESACNGKQSQADCGSAATTCFWNPVAKSGAGACQPTSGACMLGAPLCNGDVSVSASNSASHSASVANFASASKSKRSVKQQRAQEQQQEQQQKAQQQEHQKAQQQEQQQQAKRLMAQAALRLEQAAASEAYGNAVNQSLQSVYCVRMPSGFMNSIMPKTETPSAVTGCLPNVFQPQLTGNPSLFYNQTGYADADSSMKCYAGADNTTFSPVGGRTTPYFGTCLMSSESTVDKLTPPKPADNFCGCDTSKSSYCPTDDKNVSPDDYICWVEPQPTTSSGSGVQGGFALRQASLFGGKSASGSQTRGIYDVSSLYGPDNDLYKFVASPSTNVDLWAQVNTTAAQQNRLFMFMRIYYWILLTSDASLAGMNQLGLSTFLNNAGYDEKTNKPFVPLDSPTSVLAARLQFYATQPLLVYEKDSFGEHTIAAFYTLQELKEGIYTQDTSHQTSAAPTPVPDAAALLSQLSMWTYNAENNGLNGNVARDGMTLATVNTQDAQGQVNEGQSLRGLLQGTYGYCNMWYTTDQFVGGTFGTAAALVLLVVAYVLLYRKYVG